MASRRDELLVAVVRNTNRCRLRFSSHLRADASAVIPAGGYAHWSHALHASASVCKAVRCDVRRSTTPDVRSSFIPSRHP